MPEMSCCDLYRNLHKIDSEMKVSFLTGQNEYNEEFSTMFSEMDEKCFMNKPVSSDHLADRILAIIDSINYKPYSPGVGIPTFGPE